VATCSTRWRWRRDADIPVYGLAATGFAAGETPVSTLPEMAARYIEAIRSVQATGPYRLAGWSAGGLIAYEMARQLSENGDAVEFVGLLDTAPDPWRHRPAEGWTEANYLRSWLPAALPDGLQQQFDRLAAAHDLGALMALATTHDLLPPGVPRGIDADELRRCLGVAFATQQALFGYRPLPIDLPVSLFVAADEVRDDSTAAWQALLGRHLGVIPVPGTHLSMVEPPHAAELAGRLSDALAATAPLRPAPTPGLAAVH
jgi:thioesterase domain-containing protein